MRPRAYLTLWSWRCQLCLRVTGSDASLCHTGYSCFLAAERRQILAVCAIDVPQQQPQAHSTRLRQWRDITEGVKEITGGQSEGASWLGAAPSADEDAEQFRRPGMLQTGGISAPTVEGGLGVRSRKVTLAYSHAETLEDARTPFRSQKQDVAVQRSQWTMMTIIMLRK
jgi:hypothetical protein